MSIEIASEDDLFLSDTEDFEEDEEEAEAQQCTCDPCLCDCADENEEEAEEACTCDPCECDCGGPPGSPNKPASELGEADEVTEKGDGYDLDEFARAKAYFMKTSTKSGLSLYDHLSEVIRRLLDKRGPNNPVDFFEEISMNMKRYRFQQRKDVLRDIKHITEPLMNDARYLCDNWRKYSQWSDARKEPLPEGDTYVAGTFLNLLRLQYYLEQVNVGLPREEMFRLALSIKDLTAIRPHITRYRFWGKIFGSQRNYYVLEAEHTTVGAGDGDLWLAPITDRPEMAIGGEDDVPQEQYQVPEQPREDGKYPGAQTTLQRAGNVVLDPDFLTAYSKTSGLPPEQQATLLPKPTFIKALTGVDQAWNVYPEWGGEGMYPNQPKEDYEDPEAVQDMKKWQGYQMELMTGFPIPMSIPPEVEIPSEPDGSGSNRRAFYVCNDLGTSWQLLPIVSPKQINASRRIRWSLTGDLNAEIKSYPEFPGYEGHYLKALLVRATAGSMISPKGFYKINRFGEFGGEDEEFEGEEEGNAPGDDKVWPTKKYRAPLDALTNPSLTFWVHHAAMVLPQGRNVWWNPLRPKKGNESDEEFDEEEEDEYEGEGKEIPEREVAPPLFTSIARDLAPDGKSPWTLSTSSTVFKEFQVVAVKSNNWPGSTVICTIKGKVDNIYFGDGLKFKDRSFSPFVPENTSIKKEYKAGPELNEFVDPSVEEEEAWLRKLELEAIADEEPPFEDNEDEEEMDEEEDIEDVTDDD